MDYQGFILSNSQIIRKNATQLIFQGRLSDAKRFHWNVTRPGLVFFLIVTNTGRRPARFANALN